MLKIILDMMLGPQILLRVWPEGAEQFEKDDDAKCVERIQRQRFLPSIGEHVTDPDFYSAKLLVRRVEHKLGVNRTGRYARVVAIVDVMANPIVVATMFQARSSASVRHMYHGCWYPASFSKQRQAF
jgi:hypothetical protein